MAKKLNDEKFNAICESYGLVRPLYKPVKCFWTLPPCSQSYKSFARKECRLHCGSVYIVCSELLYDFSHTLSARNSVVVKNEDELHKALISMMKEYSEIIKQERKRKIEEL